jgi:choline dehydrogenase
MAAGEAGHTVTDDLNGPNPEGIGRMDTTRRNGRRCSASVAFLHPVAGRRNLHIVTGVLVAGLITQGKRVRGVRLSSPEALDVYADREVILSAGSINTPQLLMLSGIGPEDELTCHGIDIVYRAEGVGRNLQDHLNVGLKFACKRSLSIAWLDNPLAKAYVGAQWLLTKTGPVTSNIWELGGVFRSDPNTDYPNFQYHVGPVMMNARPDGGFSLADGLAIHIAQLRQQSRGRIRLRSTDPKAAPLINFDFFATPRDRAEFRGALRVTREIADQPSMRAIGALELLPGGAITSDDDVDDFIATYTNTEFHPSCTCRMGGDDDSVVDAELKVRGVEGLRVVDASVMPAVPSCNLNAPTIMIAEKAADMIAGWPPLAPARLDRVPTQAREFA